MIVGLTGASGAIYGVELLRALRSLNIETHLILSTAAAVTLTLELGLTPRQVKVLADVAHPIGDIGAGCSSGSFRAMGMIIAPCSMNTLAEVAAGISKNLIGRAADVTLKERRKLVLLTRETPLSEIHLRNMLTVTRAGAIVAPPVPAFYNRPASIEDLVSHTVGRVLDLFDLEPPWLNRWTGGDDRAQARADDD